MFVHNELLVAETGASVLCLRIPSAVQDVPVNTQIFPPLTVAAACPCVSGFCRCVRFCLWTCLRCVGTEYVIIAVCVHTLYVRVCVFVCVRHKLNPLGYCLKMGRQWERERRQCKHRMWIRKLSAVFFTHTHNLPTVRSVLFAL